MAEDQINMAVSPGHHYFFIVGTVLRISRSADDVLNLRRRLKVGTWNVRSIYQAGKAANVIKEMERLHVDILGCSEVRWPGNGKCDINEYKIYYSGDKSSQNRNGVALIVTNKVDKAVSGFFPISDRVAIMKINSKPFILNIIQTYAPTSSSSEEVIDQFYLDIKEALKLTKSNEITMLTGDFNAKVGDGEIEGITGRYGLGVRNERGDTLIEFCKEMDFSITNTYFKLPKRRLYTWKSPTESGECIVRNQIDYIMIKRRFRNMVSSAKTYPGADIYSDHNLLLAEIKLRLKKTTGTSKPVKVDMQKLKIASVNELVKEEINNRFMELKKEPVNNIEIKWNQIKEAVTNVTNENLRSERRTKNKNWMTDEILDLMEERRKYKGNNSEKYNAIHKTIRAKIKTAKEDWLKNECMEIEMLEDKHDTFNVHKKIKEITGFVKSRQIRVITDKDNNIILDIESKLKRWKEYIEELFSSRTDRNDHINDFPNQQTGLSISKAELISAMKKIKNNRAVGPDGIHGEIVKLLDEDNVSALLDLYNTVYQTGLIPKDWLISTFVPLPKKTSAKKCEEHRTISLMSHILKIFLNIIHGRVYRKLEENMSENQFGFRNGLGTRDALFSIQVMIARARDVNCDVYACFVDFEKAFDNVEHELLMSILESVGVDSNDIRIIANLYWRQTAVVRIENQTSEEISICKGVRQGCVLSPILFNIYSEFLFREALDEIDEGISVNGQIINNQRYADDTVLLASSPEGLQVLVDRLTTIGLKYGMKLNVNKTKVMVISKHAISNLHFYVNSMPLEIVHNFTYLGCLLNDEWDQSREIRARIEKARTSFHRFKKVLCNMSLNLQLRTRILRCYVFSVLLYGTESWTLTEASQSRLSAFEMWCYRRMLRISWTYRVTNDSVLQRMQKPLEVINTIKRRKMGYFGHIMRNDKYRLLRLVMQGKFDGVRGVGRRRISWLRNLRQWTGETSTGLFRAAVDKVRWTSMIVDVNR